MASASIGINPPPIQDMAVQGEQGEQFLSCYRSSRFDFHQLTDFARKTENLNIAYA